MAPLESAFAINLVLRLPMQSRWWHSAITGNKRKPLEACDHTAA